MFRCYTVKTDDGDTLGPLHRQLFQWGKINGIAFLCSARKGATTGNTELNSCTLAKNSIGTG